jgi:hypothetical protein
MDRETLLRAADAADLAANATDPEQERRAVMEIMRQKEAVAIGMMYANLRRVSDTPHLQERRPLTDDGDVIGVVEASIPAELFYRLGRQKNFGFDGFYSNEGMKDVLKAHPVCRVKTVSGKTTVGWRGQKSEVGSLKSEVRSRTAAMFGRGTLNLAT